MEKLKVIVTAVWSIILSALGILAIPVLLLNTTEQLLRQHSKLN